MILTERIMRRGARLVIGLALVEALAISSNGATKTISNDALANIDFEQKLNVQLPMDLGFVDEQGRAVRLRDYFGSKPVVLVLGYYKCPMLCSLVLNGLVESMQDLRWTAGNEFIVLNVSIDPSEGPALADAKKKTYLKRYGRSHEGDGWYFLTGKEPEIRTLAGAVGFEYLYDPISKQYAHPSGFVVVTPQGKVARYFFGIAFPSRDLYSALRSASLNQPGTAIQRLILLCFHYNPLTGRYSSTIMSVVRLLSVTTLIGLVGIILRANRRPKVA